MLIAPDRAMMGVGVPVGLRSCCCCCNITMRHTRAADHLCFQARPYFVLKVVTCFLRGLFQRLSLKEIFRYS